MQSLIALCRKHKDMLLYLLFGVLTTLVNLAVFYLFTHWLVLTPESTLIPNIIANFLAILFAFVTNRRLVFHSEKTGARAVLKEAVAFFLGRAVTLAFDLGMVFWLVDLLHWPEMPVKLGVTVVVVIGNYLISKLLVFRNRSRNEP